MIEKDERQIILEAWQARIDSLPYTSTIPYPYCCICFRKLTPNNIVEENNQLVDLCLSCLNQEKKSGYRENGHSA
jgi:hypothetical protein